MVRKSRRTKRKSTKKGGLSFNTSGSLGDPAEFLRARRFRSNTGNSSDESNELFLMIKGYEERETHLKYNILTLERTIEKLRAALIECKRNQGRNPFNVFGSSSARSAAGRPPLPLVLNDRPPVGRYHLPPIKMPDHGALNEGGKLGGPRSPWGPAI